MLEGVKKKLHEEGGEEGKGVVVGRRVIQIDADIARTRKRRRRECETRPIKK